jgi:AbrB family looped-hinge helix DNA binding protein
MKSARVTSKGQVVIPAEMRKRHGIQRGTRVVFEDHGDEIILRPRTREYFRRMAGTLKSKKSLTNVLLAERARDKEKEGR